MSECAGTGKFTAVQANKEGQTLYKSIARVFKEGAAWLSAAPKCTAPTNESIDTLYVEKRRRMVGWSCAAHAERPTRDSSASPQGASLPGGACCAAKKTKLCRCVELRE